MKKVTANNDAEAQAIDVINKAARLLENLPEADPDKLQPAVKRLVAAAEAFGVEVNDDDEA
jgi:hypothetical protein